MIRVRVRVSNMVRFRVKFAHFYTLSIVYCSVITETFNFSILNASYLVVAIFCPSDYMLCL